MRYALQDYTRLTWSTNATNAGSTGGAYLKALEVRNNRTYYYKMSLGDTYQGIIGHETVNEYIVHRLLQQLGIPHLTYNLINALVNVDGRIFTTPINSSIEYKRKDETKVTVESWYRYNRKDNEEPYQTLARYGFSDYLDAMFLVDFLIVNRDRHGANIEMLYDAQDNLRIAPLYDHGVSFVAPYQNNVSAIATFDPMADVQTTNFVGRQSLYYNLSLIRKPVVVNALKEEALRCILREVQPYLTPQHIQKIYAIITGRYMYARNQAVLCEKR